jgi:hypothetical protein
MAANPHDRNRTSWRTGRRDMVPVSLDVTTAEITI